MKTIIHCIFLCLLFTACKTKVSSLELVYPTASERKVSKTNQTYFIDPVSGNDQNLGTKKNAPWKTFKKVNQLQLTEGNTVEILSPGTFRESLFVIGEGSEKSPITIQFAPGEYQFFPEHAFKTKFHISNTNDAPNAAKAVAFYFLNSKHIKIKGGNAEIVFRGKVIETSLNNCENITVENISFDYKRPTVSEIQVLTANEHFTDVLVHKDSKYSITDSTLTWIGEGWKHNPQNLWQVFNPKSDKVARIVLPVSNMRFTELELNKVRIHYDKNPGFTKGFIYQNRHTFRDYAAIFMQNSKNISWKHVNIYFMHGMGFINQFCENITYDNLKVKPKANSGRTCAAWADILHFSGCKGDIKITNCYLSAANDDTINVHGTHLRIIDTPTKHKIKVRFMHPQTYGFKAFFANDSIEFIRAKTLLPFAKNKIVTAKLLNDKDMELTLANNIPNDIHPNDVIENTTWTPNVLIEKTKITQIPTRGILISTRGKVRIENNEILKTDMSALLFSDDANSWFESGYVRDVTVKDNQFINCGEPIINIHPENPEIIDKQAVHKNFQISNNSFITNKNSILSAKSTHNIQFLNNTIQTDKNMLLKDFITLKSCEAIEINNNQVSQ